MLFVIVGGVVFFVYRDKVYRYCINQIVDSTGRSLERRNFNKIVVLSFCNTLTNTLCGIDPYTGLLATVITGLYFPENSYCQTIINGYKFGSFYGAVKNYVFRWFIDCNFIQNYFYGFSPFRFLNRKQIAHEKKKNEKIKTIDCQEFVIVVDTKERDINKTDTSLTNYVDRQI